MPDDTPAPEPNTPTVWFAMFLAYVVASIATVWLTAWGIIGALIGMDRPYLRFPIGVIAAWLAFVAIRGTAGTWSTFRLTVRRPAR